MPANTFNGSVFTTSYSYGLNGKEYVFSCKGRPFVALVSPYLLTPQESLIDYDLIREMGLTMTDIQCRKFDFGKHKMRILGRVSMEVQCVKDGRINGNFHVKGLVIADLYQMRRLTAWLGLGCRRSSPTSQPPTRMTLTRRVMRRTCSTQALMERFLSRPL